jgi:hypothetical protein
MDEGLKQQAAMDLDAMERACGRVLSADDRAQFLAVQHQANRWTYIGSGLVHPQFLDTVRRLKPQALPEIEAMAAVFA